MSEVSPGARLCLKQESKLNIQILENKSILESLTLLLKVVKSSYGPNGKTKIIQNSSGGHVSITSSSVRLFQAMSISKPILKLISTSVQGHGYSFSDGGLFLALLAMNLTESSLKVDLPRRLLIDIHDALLELCVGYLSTSKCPCRVRIDFSRVGMLRNLAQSVVSSKPACCLSLPEIEHITLQLLEAFLSSLPGGAVQGSRPAPAVPLLNIHILGLEGKPAMDTYTTSGMLFQTPQFPLYYKALNVQRDISGRISVVLFDISMSGDTEELIDARYEMTDGLHTNEATEQVLMDQCRHLVRRGVGLVACQKVVHPRLKKYLRSEGVMVLDRLGMTHMAVIKLLLGVCPVSVLHGDVTDEHIGWLDEVKHVLIAGKSYVHLQRHECPVVTVVLCNRHEEALEELKVVCNQVLQLLSLTLSSPWALYGAGCWEVNVAQYLLQHFQDQEVCEDLTSKLECSRSQLNVALGNFVTCLRTVALTLANGTGDHVTDSTNHHHWLVQTHAPLACDWSKVLRECCCGVMSNDRQDLIFKGLDSVQSEGLTYEAMASSPPPQTLCGLASRRSVVLDSYPSRLNALKVAVATANLILSIGSIIEDRN